MVGQREFMDAHDAWVRGKSISEIARQTGRDRKTIRRLLREGAQTARKPRQISTKLDPFREYLLARMVGEDPVTNAEVLYDEIYERGYRGGRSILKEFMHPFRALAKEKATVRFETPPGHQAQVDWGTFKKPGRKRVQGFVMTLGWSRAQYLDFTDSQALALFLACHEQAFHYLGGVPEEILYDRVKTVWLHDDDRGDQRCTGAHGASRTGDLGLHSRGAFLLQVPREPKPLGLPRPHNTPPCARPSHS